MEQNSTTSEAADTTLFAGEAWFDPIEVGIRDRIRGFIGELLEQELTTSLGRGRHERAPDTPKSYRHGTRERQRTGSFGPIALSVPRARLASHVRIPTMPAGYSNPHPHRPNLMPPTIPI